MPRDINAWLMAQQILKIIDATLYQLLFVDDGHIGWNIEDCAASTVRREGNLAKVDWAVLCHSHRSQAGA
ncbi:hypothetical protein [Pseudophaeobacter leonis]|uniref:hypothetical protein n=1 Tax=Pseudophaeobacter leonis TaxID=1144477 RepID=UPI001570F199|nr:hypothetical protein [Pseudophaeobacter leonis]